MDQDHKIKLKNVTQGRDFGKTIEILTGIERDDAVVINPPDSIQDGIAVRIAPPPSKAQAHGKPPARKAVMMRAPAHARCPRSSA